MNELQLEQAVERMISKYVYGLQPMLIEDLMRDDYEGFSVENVVNGEYYNVDSRDGESRLALTRTQLDELIKTIEREREYYDYHSLDTDSFDAYLEHLNQAEPTPRDFYYWYHVEEGWFAEKLIEQGEIVLVNDYGSWWSKGAGEMKQNDAIVAITKEVMGYA